MGAAASSIPDKGATLDEFKKLSGDRFDQAWFDKNKNGEGLVTKDQLMEYHKFISSLDRFKVKKDVKLIRLFKGQFGNKIEIIKPVQIIKAGTIVESDFKDSFTCGEGDSYCVETFCLRIPALNGWILGYSTAKYRNQTLDTWVTDIDEAPIVVTALPQEQQKPPVSPKKIPSNKEQAAKVIQKNARIKQKKEDPKPKKKSKAGSKSETKKEEKVSNLRKFKVTRKGGCHVTKTGTTEMTGEVIPEGKIIEAESVNEVPNVIASLKLAGGKEVLWKQAENLFLEEVDVKMKPTYKV